MVPHRVFHIPSNGGAALHPKTFVCDLLVKLSVRLVCNRSIVLFALFGGGDILGEFEELGVLGGG